MDLQVCLQTIAPSGPDGHMWTGRIRILAEAVLVFAAAKPEEIFPESPLQDWMQGMLEVSHLGRMWQKHPESAALLGRYLQSLPGFRADQIDNPSERVLDQHGYVSSHLWKKDKDPDARKMMAEVLSGLRDGRVTLDLDRALESGAVPTQKERL
jgi:hypothetical protein